MNRRIRICTACLCISLRAAPIAAQVRFESIPTLPDFDGGAALGDYDNDGYPDLMIRANLGGNEHQYQLFHNEGGGLFVDHSAIIVPERPKTGIFSNCRARFWDIQAAAVAQIPRSRR